MLFRPVRENDLDDIVRLAARAGVGMTSLPHDAGRLAARIRRSIDTFAGALPRGQQGFLFVLEDTALERWWGSAPLRWRWAWTSRFTIFAFRKRFAPRKRWESISLRSCSI